jgi:serine/threonine-protein kinase
MAGAYANIRRFPAALRIYDRALDIMPNEGELMAAKATVCQAQGKLQEAARLLAEINWRTSIFSLNTKINQLRLERNYGEAVRLEQARQAQFHFASEFEKACYQVSLALTQRLAGDTAGAKLTAEQARKTLEPFYGNQPDSQFLTTMLSFAYAGMGEKDSALKLAERAIMLSPRAKDAGSGPGLEENLARIQANFGENSRAISTLAQLLQTPYAANPTPITPALLRLDPFWDPLRNDPAFQKLCEEKQP